LPETRKLNQNSTSRFVTLPKSWLDYYEKQEGRKIVSIALEVNGKLILSPIFEPIKPVLEHKETLLGSFKKKFEKEPKLY
jgi:hypothetical protein